MSDESVHQPSVTEEAQQKTVTISLKDMAQRYLTAMQRIHDIAALVVQGTREVNEKGFDELVTASRFLPNREQRRKFEDAKPLAERWILKNLLSDAFGAIVPFLEDARTICALNEWKKAGSDQKQLPPIFQEERQTFLRLRTEPKLKHLEEKFGLKFRLSEHLSGLEELAACLLRTDGTVAEDGKPLTFTLVSLDLIAKPGSDRPVQPQVGELKKEFAPGSTVTLDKVDYMNVLATVALFMNEAMRQLQEKVSKPA